MSKRYQGLRTENMFVAKEVYEALKHNKCLSEANFSNIYYGRDYGTPADYHSTYDSAVRTIKQFLYDHGLMKRTLINGIVIYSATQKCFRTRNFETATTYKVSGYTGCEFKSTPHMPYVEPQQKEQPQQKERYTEPFSGHAVGTLGIAKDADGNEVQVLILS